MRVLFRSPEADPSTAPHRFASWAGKWTGVEGLYVTITPTEPEHYKLEMQSDLDTKGTYEGHDSEHGIQFERGGKPFTLYRANGDDAGLKYLAGKKECLKVQDGEGYCRDRSEEHTSELQSLMRISYAVFCLTKKKKKSTQQYQTPKKTNT